MTHVPWSGIAGGAGARYSPGWWLAHRYRNGSKSLPRVADRMNSDWAALEQEVDAWREAGREVTLWWRDDDAAEPSLALSRLLRLRPPGCPLGLAVIPAAAKATLAGELTGAVDVLVHGFAHANHAAPGARKSEYPAGRAAPDELREGRERLDELFGDRALPVFVPPWNRMGEDAAAALPAAGYRVLSGYRGRPEGPLPRLDTHVDLVDWRRGRRFAGGGGCSARSPKRSLCAATREWPLRPGCFPTIWCTTRPPGGSSNASSHGARTRRECAGSAPATRFRSRREAAGPRRTSLSRSGLHSANPTCQLRRSPPRLGALLGRVV